MHPVIANQSVNTVLSWLVTVGLVALALWTAVAGSILWTGFVLASLGIVLAPAVITRDFCVMPNWVVLAALTLALVGRAVGPFRPTLVYVALAALALLVAVEIDAFSSASFTPWFAATFVTFVTMAIAGLWGIAQYATDTYLGTSYLTTRTDLMWELVVATGVGIGAGLVFAVTVLTRSTDGTVSSG